MERKAEGDEDRSEAEEDAAEVAVMPNWFVRTRSPVAVSASSPEVAWKWEKLAPKPQPRSRVW